MVVKELQHTNSELAERLAQRSAESEQATRKAERLQLAAIVERNAHAEASAELADTNAELERRLADHSQDDKALAQDSAVLKLKHINALPSV